MTTSPTIDAQAITDQQIDLQPDNSSTTAFSRPSVFAQRDTPPPWLRETLGKLDSLAGLQEDWDSYGAAPVDIRSVVLAKELIDELAMFINVDEPAVGATPEGYAGFSWDGGAWSLDIDIRPDGLLECVAIDEHSPDGIELATRDPGHLLCFLPAWS